MHGAGGLPAALLKPFDDLLDLAGRDRGLLGQIAHLLGHHRKAPSLLTRPRRFYGRVECQQVGLLGDVMDHLQHPANLLGLIDHRLHRSIGNINAARQRQYVFPGLIHRQPPLPDLIAGLTGTLQGVVNMPGDLPHGREHQPHGTAHPGHLVQLVLSAVLQGMPRPEELMTQLPQAAAIPCHTVHQIGHLLEEVIEALPGRELDARCLRVRADALVELVGRHQHLVQHLLILGGIGQAEPRQIDEDHALHHHIKRVQEDHSPTAMELHHIDRKAGVLQHMKQHVMHRDHRRRDHDRQPVAVEGQHRQQHEDAEMDLDDPPSLVDVQRRHHHQPYPDEATHPSSARQHPVERRQQRADRAAHQRGLQPSIMPKCQSSRTK
ncbi:hypothetical protein D3C79_630360 [compost metagenome]